jgi:hypothetical protein
MTREIGYYYLISKADPSEWIIAHWNGKYWAIPGTDIHPTDEEVLEDDKVGDMIPSPTRR